MKLKFGKERDYHEDGWEAILMHNKEIKGKASKSGPQVQKAARRKRQPERRSK